MKCSVIVPAYNEERRISDCLESLILHLPDDYEIIVSADGCSDMTIETARKFPVKIVTFQEQLGKGGGILNALEKTEGERIVIADVDLSVSPIQIPEFVEELENADVILGSRNLKGSKILVKPPFYRKFLGKVFNWLFRKLFGLKFFDTQCGFKAIKRGVLEDLSSELNIEGFAFDVDLIVKAIRKGYKVIEVPIEWSYKKGSKVNTLKQIYFMGRDLLIVWLETKKKEIEVSNLKEFYGSIEGDVYEKASKSYFFPRRFWHNHKNSQVVKRVTAENILDVGCGSGTIVKRLLRKGKNVVGIDIGKKFIKFCHSNHERAMFCLSDAGCLPFGDKMFDTVICSEVIEHLENPNKTLKEFNRVLEEKGKLILTTPKISFRWALIEAIWTRIRRGMLETRHKSFTRGRLRVLLDKSGFAIETNDSFMLGCLLIVEAKKCTRADPETNRKVIGDV